MPSATPSPVGSDGPPVNVLRLTLILASLTAFAPFATDMYLASFPTLAKSFGTDIGAAQLSLSVFFLGLALGQLIYGPLIDRLGRRLPLLVGTGVFAVTSLLTAFAPTIESFIGLRFLQAAGGCAGMIISRAIISDLFQAREAARVLSLMMVVQGMAPIVAPVLGGYIAAAAGWQAIFLFLAGLGLVSLGIAWWGLPETLKPEQRQRRTDLRRALAVFGHLIAKRDFIMPTLVAGFVFACLFAFISGSPAVYMGLNGVSQQNYGWLFGFNAIGLSVGAQVNRLLLKRFLLQRVIGWALIVNVAGGLALVLAGANPPLPVLVALLWICVATLPLSAANAIALAMAASGEQRGSGSAIIGVLQFVIAGLVSAVIGVLHPGTAYPMTVAILACGLIAGGIWMIGQRPR
jgi:MFS transporter, DHA1 family, multidrug resistance protein